MAKKDDQARITIDLPLTLQKKLKIIAAINGMSMREIVEKAIKQYLEQLETYGTSSYKSLN
jgi:hypothetical protein